VLQTPRGDLITYVFDAYYNVFKYTGIYLYTGSMYNVWENHTWTFKMAFEGLWVSERRGGSAKPGNNGGDRSATAHLAKTVYAF